MISFRPTSHFLLLLGGLLVCGARGFFQKPLVGNLYAATLGAGSAANVSRLSGAANPAALQPGYQALTVERSDLYQIPGLNFYEIYGYWDQRRWGTSFTLNQAGLKDLYLEHSLKSQTSLKAASFLNIGASYTLQRLEIAGFGNDTYSSLDIGSLIQLSPQFKVGAIVYHCETLFRKANFHRPLFQIGGNLVYKSTSLSLDYFRNEYGVWWKSLGQTLKIGKHLEIALGIAEKPLRFSLGIRLHFLRTGVGSALQYHEYLGLSRFYSAFLEREVP